MVASIVQLNSIFLLPSTLSAGYHSCRGLFLSQTKRTDPRLLSLMERHYSQPRGFVGRNICYAVMYGSEYYGHTIAGSATRFLPNRNEWFGVSIKELNKVINNIFFHIEKVAGKYPIRNFASKVVKEFVKVAGKDWQVKYGDIPVGFESLVELPRKGDVYLRAGWALIGQTKGYTCKRIAGKGTDSWTGKRVWDTKNLRPKKVFVFKYDK